MSTWIERGEVLDSDDDDLWDSHLASPDVARHAASTTDHQPVGQVGRDGAGLTGLAEAPSLGAVKDGDDDDLMRPALEEGLFVFKLPQDTMADGTPSPAVSQPTSPCQPQRSAVDAKLQSDAQLDTGLPHSSASARFVIATLDADHLARSDQETRTTQPSRLSVPECLSSPPQQSVTHDAEDISRSYVKISSGLSSPLSSLSRTPSPQRPSSQTSHATSVSHTFATEQADRNRAAQADSTKRVWSLRERQPIQLAPYFLEHERYKRTIAGTGMRPVVIATSTSQDSVVARDFPNADFEDSGDTQMPEAEHDSEPILSSQPLLVSDTHSPVLPSNGRVEYGDDDDLPDIARVADQLRKSFSKSKRRKLNSIQNGENTTLVGQTAGIEDLWDPHASPIPHHGIISSCFYTPLITAEHPTSLPHQSTPLPTFHVPPDLSQPKSANNISKHVYDSTMDVFGEGDDVQSFALRRAVSPDVRMAAQSITSDSESEQEKRTLSPDIQRVDRRIRGVLPASWLRLDHHEPHRMASRVIRARMSRSPSPERYLGHRGVALPRSSHSQRLPADLTLETRNYFLSDEESGNDSPHPTEAVHLPPLATPAPSANATLETDTVYEADRIDGMLPTPRRRSDLMLGVAKTRRKNISTGLVRHRPDAGLRQSRITEKSSKLPMQTVPTTQQKPKVYRKRSHGPTKRPIDVHRLSILDTISYQRGETVRVPQFLRLAVRNVKQRRDLGRQSPTRKVVRLETREATADAQERLREWRRGALEPRPDSVRPSEADLESRLPLGLVAGDSGIRLGTVSAHRQMNRPDCETPVWRDESSVGDQALTSTQSICSFDQGPRMESSMLRQLQRKPERPQIPIVLRNGQLETLESGHCPQYPALTFGARKRVLDLAFKTRGRATNVQDPMQLENFLSDDNPLFKQDYVYPSIEDHGVDNQVLSPPIEQKSTSQIAGRKKTRPTRLDVTAIRYRQPSEAILKFLNKPPKEDICKNPGSGKLRGLGPYGTVYSIDFDAVRLPHGTFFRADTFIGSGKLAAILQPREFRPPAIRSSFKLGGRDLCWDAWDEQVFAELGLCFDGMIDELEKHEILMTTERLRHVTSCSVFIIEYMQVARNHLANSPAAILRITDLLQSWTKCFAKFADRVEPTKQELCNITAEIGCLSQCLTLLVLQLARESSEVHGVQHLLEDHFKNIAATTIDVLLRNGPESMRQLADDLQYLSFRKSGIDSSIPEAWIITMHTITEARIPRTGFWDVFNNGLDRKFHDWSNNARTMEEAWFAMYALIPFAAVTSGGTIGSPDNYVISDNWSFVAQMNRAIFAIYANGERQSAGFNDYCRAIFVRCHHLMTYWNWRHHGAIVGSLFDSFASERLAFLRNEPLSASPRFLQELHEMPSLRIEPGDACFHILLKIVALSFKQMALARDTKAMRNLVARLLPNHDRQYPKEDVIREEDLASLRNHHDLICTLFWAAPAALRPSVQLLRNLVQVDRSHREAYLISLRAWRRLAQFILSGEVDAVENLWPQPPLASEHITAYEPFAVWQAESYEQLLHLYHSASNEVNEQLSRMTVSSRRTIGQDMPDAVARANRIEIMGLMTKNLVEVEVLVREVSTMDKAYIVMQNQHFELVMLSVLTRISIAELSGVRIIEAALNVIEVYLNRLRKLTPVAVPTSVQQDEDSQDYGADVFDEGSSMLEYIGELNGKVQSALRDLLKRIFRVLNPLINKAFVDRVLLLWASLASLLIQVGLNTRSEYVSDSGEMLLDGVRVPAAYGDRFVQALRPY